MRISMYVCFYFLIAEGKSLQIQYKYFNINIVYSAPRGLSTTFKLKQNIKLSSMTQYVIVYIKFTYNYIEVLFFLPMPFL